MQHYKDENDKIYAYDSDDQMKRFNKVPLTPITEAEKDEILARKTEKPEPPQLRTLKTDVWQRCTVDEAEILDAALDQAPAKERRIWSDSLSIEHDSEYFATLKAQMESQFGEQRTAELLAPSDGV